MKDELFYKVWISSLDIENITKIKLLEYGNFENIWESELEFLEKMDIPKRDACKIFNCKFENEIERKIEVMKKQNIEIINIKDKRNYPRKLIYIENAPAFIYVRGNKKVFDNDSVAIVGSRKSTQNGNNIARKIATKLADNDITIVSGLAIGIDKYAHLGALDSVTGKTIAVLGGGIDDESIYPYENKRVFERIIEKGGMILSEYSVFEKPEGEHFPARNRIISGLADKVIVVEAKKRSGALITANYALEQGRDLYAIPGDFFSINKEGTNNLIKNGCAYLLSTFDDLKFK